MQVLSRTGLTMHIHIVHRYSLSLKPIPILHFKKQKNGVKHNLGPHEVTEFLQRETEYRLKYLYGKLANYERDPLF